MHCWPNNIVFPCWPRTNSTNLLHGNIRSIKQEMDSRADLTKESQKWNTSHCFAMSKDIRCYSKIRTVAIQLRIEYVLHSNQWPRPYYNRKPCLYSQCLPSWFTNSHPLNNVRRISSWHLVLLCWPFYFPHFQVGT